MNFKSLRKGEMAIISGFIRDLNDHRTEADFGNRLIEICTEYFGGFAQVIAFDVVNLSTGRYSAVSNRPDDFFHFNPAIREYIHQNPSWAYAASGGQERVLMITDFLSERQWMETDFYRQVFKEMGVRHQLAVSLSKPGFISGLTLNGDTAPGVEIRLVLHALAPHILHAYDVALRGRSPAYLLSHADPDSLGLTDREMEVLRWMARGYSDAELAAVLEMGIHLVRKHVDRILEKLGVYTRLGAVARARELLRL